MTERFDVVVIGAGPAGVAAAREVSTRGLTVAVLDEQQRAGDRSFAARRPRSAPGGRRRPDIRGRKGCCGGGGRHRDRVVLRHDGLWAVP
ncbi:FAD-dependent oxidoreductase [Leifsonia poae]|uniref:FAD-dependent oxidoreductase n=1 Tax=Leifsonia poae TaxID=110933 RepID=UPI0035A9AC81